MSEKLKVVVIGTGNIGSILASNLVRGERAVIVADRNPEKAKTLAQTLGSIAQSMSVESALKEGDIIVLAIYFDAIKNFFNQYSGELKGKIIVDPSNPIAPDEKGGFKKIIDQGKSSGMVLSGLLPQKTILVKAFGTLSADSLAKKSFQHPERFVLFYATDDRSIDPIIDELINDSGFTGMRIGNLDASIRVEVFGDLHEFGAVGKPVTSRDAKSLL